uniref:Uncharacterized protein n=1 Tax=Globodera rostochiensis TaxID=31243 RepID=A0A914HLB3_GLORO
MLIFSPCQLNGQQGFRRPIESAEERPPLATEWPMNGPAHWDGAQPNPISVQGGQERYLKGGLLGGGKPSRRHSMDD